MDDAPETDQREGSSRRTFLRRMAVVGVAAGVPAVSSFALSGCFLPGGHGSGGNTGGGGNT